MNREQFNAILPIKIQDFISLIKKEKNLDFDKAISFLYSSILYEKLSDEETKLWHLSTEKLLDMLLIEKKTGKIEYPDFV